MGLFKPLVASVLGVAMIGSLGSYASTNANATTELEENSTEVESINDTNYVEPENPAVPAQVNSNNVESINDSGDIEPNVPAVPAVIRALGQAAVNAWRALPAADRQMVTRGLQAGVAAEDEVLVDSEDLEILFDE